MFPTQYCPIQSHPCLRSSVASFSLVPAQAHTSPSRTIDNPIHTDQLPIALVAWQGADHSYSVHQLWAFGTPLEKSASPQTQDDPRPYPDKGSGHNRNVLLCPSTRRPDNRLDDFLCLCPRSVHLVTYRRAPRSSAAAALSSLLFFSSCLVKERIFTLHGPNLVVVVCIVNLPSTWLPNRSASNRPKSHTVRWSNLRCL